MPSTEALFERYGPAYRWLATGTAMLAAMAVVLSTTIINVAIPAVMGQFGIDQTKAQWLSTGFLAAMTATMLLTAAGEKRLGQKGTMVLALSVFLAGSVLGALAPDENILILARIIQGAAAGVVQPLAMVVIFQVFPPQQRGTAMGIFGIGVVLAPALGPWVGGLLMDSFSWRLMFYLGIPFAAGGIVLSQLFLPDRKRGAADGFKFDWPALVLLTLGLFSLLQALSSGGRLGWDSNPVLAMFLVAGIATALFLWREAHCEQPLLDLRVFRNGAFAAANLVSFVMGAGLFGSMYLLPLFVQQVQHLTPTQSGLLLMPAGFVLLVVFPIAGRLSDKVSPGLMIGGGLAVFALSAWLTSHVSAATSFAALAVWTALGRVGLGAIFPSLSAASLAVLQPAQVAQGSGAMNFTRQLGGALGTNLLAVELQRRTVFHGEAFAATLGPDNNAALDFLRAASGALHTLGLAGYEQAGASAYLLGQSIYAQALTAAYRDGFLISALLFAFALLPTWLLHHAHTRSRKQSALAAELTVEAGPGLTRQDVAAKPA